MCPAVGKNIREVEDRKKILYYNGPLPMYAKKYVCKICGYEWNKL
jgi:rubrerythrin